MLGLLFLPLVAFIKHLFENAFCAAGVTHVDVSPGESLNLFFTPIIAWDLSPLIAPSIR